MEGNLEGLGWGPEGWRAAGTCALCRIWLVRTWCLQETPRNRADNRNTPSSTRPAGCWVVCSSQRMCAFPSVQCVECVSGKAHHCRPASACPQHLFSNRILPFVFPFSLSSRHPGRLDACRTMPRRQWDKGHCSRHTLRAFDVVWSPDVKYVKYPVDGILRAVTWVGRCLT